MITSLTKQPVPVIRRLDVIVVMMITMIGGWSARIPKSNSNILVHGWLVTSNTNPPPPMSSSVLLVSQQQKVPAVYDNTVHQSVSAWLSSSWKKEEQKESLLSSLLFLSLSTSPATPTIPMPPTTLSSSSSSSTVFIAATSTQQQQPSKQDVTLLRNAFAEFYSETRNLDRSLQLLTQTITIWEEKRLPADELSGLYRIRGDCYMLLGNAPFASNDYDKSVTLLDNFIATSKQQQKTTNADGDDYDDYEDLDEQFKNELIIALLGRARANKSLVSTSGALPEQQRRDLMKLSITDYERTLMLSSREEWDSKDQMILDGSVRNPYAAWELGTVLRINQQYEDAAKTHLIASQAFTEIGDKPRSIIAYIDAGIDYASAVPLAGGSKNKNLLEQAENILKKGIEQTKGINSRDVPLLRRVIGKEGEGRMALASLLWNDNKKQDAEIYLGDACIRLDQMQIQYDMEYEKLQQQQNQKNPQQPPKVISATTSNAVRYSIDDDTQGVGLTCSKFKNKSFLTDQLHWSESLQTKVIQLETLR